MNRVFLAAAVLAAFSSSALAQPVYQTRVGTLSCDASVGIRVIVSSKKSITCIFAPSQPGPREIYSATIEKSAREAPALLTTELIWAVITPSNRRFGSLTGRYVGAPADAGENALIGGVNRSVVLQPVSLEGGGSINLAAWISDLKLKPAR